jgi:hypothetical protein
MGHNLAAFSRKERPFSHSLSPPSYSSIPALNAISALFFSQRADACGEAMTALPKTAMSKNEQIPTILCDL